MSGYRRAFSFVLSQQQCTSFYLPLNDQFTSSEKFINVSAIPMRQDSLHRHLLNFLLVSASSFLIGTIHGMLQVMPPIRAWLDSIGSPYGGPGHMIDPLAHAHMNLVGGVVMLSMCVTFYLLPIFTGGRLYSVRLVKHTFWWVSIGVYSFYLVQMTFGIWEGTLLLSRPQDVASVHHFYGPAMAVSGTTMAIGFCTFFANVIMTFAGKRSENVATEQN